MSDVDGLRARASLLPDGVIDHEGDCCGSLCEGCGHCCHSVVESCKHQCDLRGGGCVDAVMTDEVSFRLDVLAALDRLAAAEVALRRIVSDEVWNGADDPEDVMISIAQEALKPVVAAGVLRDALDRPAAPLTASGAQDDPECHEKPADDRSKP